MTRRRHPRAYAVTVIVHAHPQANVETVRSLVRDLEWVGGCRDPDDPSFASLDVGRIHITRAKEKDR